MEKVKVLSERRDSRLTVEVGGEEFIEYPSLNLSVAVANEGFCEAHGGGLVALNEYKAFVVALRQCEYARRGRAVLSGMSPGELEIIIESSDSLGHFQLSYSLGKTSFASRTVRLLTVTGGFDLDVEFLPQLVADFAALLPATEDERDQH